LQATSFGPQAVFYNLREGASLFLTTMVDNPASLAIARTQGFEAMMSQHFQIFEHIANSVRPALPK
jgi:hypothetical protein